MKPIKKKFIELDEKDSLLDLQHNGWVWPKKPNDQRMPYEKNDARIFLMLFSDYAQIKQKNIEQFFRVCMDLSEYQCELRRTIFKCRDSFQFLLWDFQQPGTEKNVFFRCSTSSGQPSCATPKRSRAVSNIK